MLYKETSLQLSEDAYKTFRGVRVINRKEFKKHTIFLGLHGVHTNVIRCTRLKSVPHEEAECYCNGDGDYLLCGEKYYELRSKIHGSTIGYIAVSDTLFIRVVHDIRPVLALLPLVPIACSAYFLMNPKVQEETREVDIPVASDSVDYTQGDVMQSAEPADERIVIPGYVKFTANSYAKSVQLWNPEGNSVYFQYEVYILTESGDKQTFPTEQEALQYVDEQETEYYSLRDGDGASVFDMDDNPLEHVTLCTIYSDGESYQVETDFYDICYVSDLVEPSMSVLWDAYTSTPPGVYTYRFKINTFDLETKIPCSGAFVSVIGTIEE